MARGGKNMNKLVLYKNMRGGANCMCDDDLDAGVDDMWWIDYNNYREELKALEEVDAKDKEMVEAYQHARRKLGWGRFSAAVHSIIATHRPPKNKQTMADVVLAAAAAAARKKGQGGGGLEGVVQVAYEEFYKIVMGDMAFDATDPTKNINVWKFCPSELSKHALFLEALKQKIGKTQLLEGLKNYRAHCVSPIMNYYERIFKFYRVAATNKPRESNRGSTPYLILSRGGSAVANLEIKSITQREHDDNVLIGFWPGGEEMRAGVAASLGIEIPAPFNLMKFLFTNTPDISSTLNEVLSYDILKGFGSSVGYIYKILVTHYDLLDNGTVEKSELARLLIYVACCSVKDILWHHCCIHPDILDSALFEVWPAYIPYKNDAHPVLLQSLWSKGRERVADEVQGRRLEKIKYKSSNSSPTLEEVGGGVILEVWRRYHAETIAELQNFLSADTTNLFETIGYEEQKVDVAGKEIKLKESQKEVSKREQVIDLYPFWVLHDIIFPPPSGGTGDWLKLYQSLYKTLLPLAVVKYNLALHIYNKIHQYYTSYPSTFPKTQEEEMEMLVAQRNSLNRLAITAECENALRAREDMKTRFGAASPYTPNKKVSYFSGYVFKNPDTGDYYWTPDCEHIFPYKYVALYFGQPLIGEHFTVLNSTKRIQQNELLVKLDAAISAADGTLLPPNISNLWTNQDAWNDFAQIHYSELQNFYGWGESSVNRFIKGDKLVYNVTFTFDPADPANVTEVNFTPEPTAGGGGGTIWDTMNTKTGPYLPPWDTRFNDTGNYTFHYLSGKARPKKHMTLTTAYGEDLNTRFNNADRRKFWMNDGSLGNEDECLHIQLLKKVIASPHKLVDFQIRNNLSTLKIINHFIITTSMLLYSFPKIKFEYNPSAPGALSPVDLGTDTISGAPHGQNFLKYAIYWIWKFLTLFITKTTLTSSYPGERPTDAIRKIIRSAILDTYYTYPSASGAQDSIIIKKIESALLILVAKNTAKSKKKT
jgi:hypothetical protein